MISEFQDLSDKIDRLAQLTQSLRAENYLLRQANHVLSVGTDILWRRKVARMVRRWAPARVLDVASGTGDLALEIQDLGQLPRLPGGAPRSGCG